jgi:hypothetical protein
MVARRAAYSANWLDGRRVGGMAGTFTGRDRHLENVI